MQITNDALSSLPHRRITQRLMPDRQSPDSFQHLAKPTDQTAASTLPALNPSDKDFVTGLEEQMAHFETDACRHWFLFHTAKLLKQSDTRQLFTHYPELTDPKTFKRIQKLYNAYPDSDPIQRIFYKTLSRYIQGKLSQEMDALDNTQNRIRMEVSDLGLKNKQGVPVRRVSYEDVEYWLINTVSDTTRAQLLKRWKQAYLSQVKGRQAAILERNKALMAALGYPHIVDFYSRITGHPLRRLAGIAKQLVDETQNLYQAQMGPKYAHLTGKPFSEAPRSDIWYVLNGPDPELTELQRYFPEKGLIPLAEKTFDSMGLSFSSMARKVDYASLPDYHRDIASLQDNQPHILLDVAKREGKMSRPYMLAAKAPSEIYLSVKPSGGLGDYKSFFHEVGHACHFAYEDPANSFSANQLGNYAVTETYAYLFEKLMLNRYWLQHEGGLTPQQSNQVVRKLALTNLYGLRRYAAKLRFEVDLYDGDARQKTDIAAQGRHYAALLTQATGFKYDPDVWLRDLDSDFYAADYFTAWTLEAQLKDHLERTYGTPEVHGEDWYKSPAAGDFLKTLWRLGRADPIVIARAIGSTDPYNPGALLQDIRGYFKA